MMPKGDGTGPKGEGPGTGMRWGKEEGKGWKEGFGAGPGGTCVCPNCGERKPHERGIPCFDQKCPKCGAAMTRE